MPDEMRELGFPIQGLDVSGEFMTQPGLTTPRASNVRAADPLAMRLRGGSRTGLAKFVDEQVSGANLIQHLNVVVDPTVDALIPDYVDGTSNLTPDPTEPARNPFGRSVRTGGSGTPILRHKPLPQGRFVQSESTFVPGVGSIFSPQNTSSGSVAFDADVTAGNLIVVTLRYAPGASNTPVFDPANVTDTAGTHYLKAVEAAYPSAGPNAAVIFYGIVPVTGTGPNTVSVTVTTDGDDVGEYTIDVLEYRRVAQSGALGGTAFDGGQFVWTGDYTLTPGRCPAARDDSIMIVVVSHVAGTGSADMGPAPAFETDPQPHQRGFGSGPQQLRGRELFDLMPVEASALGLAPTYTAHPNTTPNGSNIFWAMAAATFSPP